MKSVQIDFHLGELKPVAHTWATQNFPHPSEGIARPKQYRRRRRANLIDLGNGVVILSPRRSRVDEIADKQVKEWQDSGETLASMLSTLREVRTEYAAKRP